MLGIVLATVLLGGMTGTAQAAFWTPGKAESYLERNYANITLASCKGTPGRSYKAPRRARKWSAFLCVAFYTNDNTGTVGMFPLTEYRAYVTFF